VTDEEVDRILEALGEEGFTLPYAARSSDYLPSEYPTPSGWSAEARAAGIAALRVADDEAWRQNRDALRRAMGDRIERLPAGTDAPIPGPTPREITTNQDEGGLT
jgi:hypothetical protein